MSVRLLGLGLVLATIGDSLYGVAVIWTAVRLVGGAGGAIAAAQAGAGLVFAVAGGIVADRWSRRRALVLPDVVRAAAAAALAVAVDSGEPRLLSLVLGAAIVGAMSAIFVPAVHASIAAGVKEPAARASASRATDIGHRLTRIITPALAGLLAAHFSLDVLLWVDAAFFVASAIVVGGAGGRIPRPVSKARAERGAALGVIRDLGHAARFVRSHPTMSGAFAAVGCVTVAYAAGFTIGAPLLVAREHHGDARAYALLLAAYGAGSIVSNVAVSGVRMTEPARFVAAGAALLGVGLAVIDAAPSLPFVAAGAFVAALGGPLGSLGLLTMIQTDAPRRHLGKLLSLRVAVEQGGCTLGLLVATPLHATLGVHATIGVTAVAGVLAALLPTRWRSRAVRSRAQSHHPLPPDQPRSAP